MGHGNYNTNQQFTTIDRQNDGWVPRDVTDINHGIWQICFVYESYINETLSYL